MSRRFKMNHKEYINRLTDNKGMLLKPLEPANETGQICFTWFQVYCIAKATGLRSKKKRHIVKRFRLVMHEAIEELVSTYKP